MHIHHTHFTSVTYYFISSHSTCAHAGIKANWVILTEIRVPSGKGLYPYQGYVPASTTLPTYIHSMKPSATGDMTCHVHCANKGMSSHQQHLDWAFQAPEILLPLLGQLEPYRTSFLGWFWKYCYLLCSWHIAYTFWCTNQNHAINADLFEGREYYKLSLLENQGLSLYLHPTS